MLKSRNRLKNFSAFIATYKQNRSVCDGLFVLYVGKNIEEGEIPKFGFVVSKKIHKRAVKRNFIKRRMRESVRLYLKNDGKTQFLSYIFKAKSNSLGKNFEEINKSILSLIKKAEESFCKFL